MSDFIRIAILDDQPAIVEGYISRLRRELDIKVVHTLNFAEDLLPALERQPVDVLLLDLDVRASEDNPVPYSTIHLVPRLNELYPDLAILVISMHLVPALIDGALRKGINGYILKDDPEGFRLLPDSIRTVASRGLLMSRKVRDHWQMRATGRLDLTVTQRQIEALSLCASYPNDSWPKIANRMNIEPSTVRVMMWDVYRKLGVNTRSAAILKARQMHLLPPDILMPVE